MIPATIATAVAPETIAKVTRLFNNTAFDVICELLQNARRAGAQVPRRRPPGFGQNRIGDQTRLGERARHFREAARHVIAGGHDDEAFVAPLGAPAHSFVRVPDGIERLVSEVDTAREQFAAEPRQSQHVVLGVPAVDA